MAPSLFAGAGEAPAGSVAAGCSSLGGLVLAYSVFAGSVFDGSVWAGSVGAGSVCACFGGVAGDCASLVGCGCAVGDGVSLVEPPFAGVVAGFAAGGVAGCCCGVEVCDSAVV